MPKGYWKTHTYIHKGGWKNTFKKWVKGKFERGKPKDVYSRRFGYLNLYNGKEQANLICPSGYTVRQCFNKLRWMWLGYKQAKTKGKLDEMKKYALEIQAVQKDMGIETTSFPFLGIFGEKFVLYDKVHNSDGTVKSKTKKVDEDHRKYLKAQEMRNLKLEVGKDEEIQTLVDDRLHEPQKQDATVPLLVQPEYDEEVLIMADEVPFQKCPVCEKCGAYMSFDKKHECPTELEILSDNIPFRTD